jgi:hypothetical protein
MSVGTIWQLTAGPVQAPNVIRANGREPEDFALDRILLPS